MRRTIWMLILLLTVALTAEPLLHTHPLNNLSPDLHSSMANDSGLLCAICATAAARSIPHLPVVAAPGESVWSVAAVPVAKLARFASATLPSRAPPAA